jgi:hypothetical protein
MPSMFTRPIPGQSLTTEPGNAPWEQPALHSRPEAALAFHLEKFDKPERMEDLLFLLEQGMPISTFVESLTSAATMGGVHTLDTAVLIQPVLHDYFKNISDSAGIKYKEFGGPSPEEKEKVRMNKRFSVVLQNALGAPTDDSVQAPVQEENAVAQQRQMEATDQAGPTSQGNGLVPRRA